MALRVFIHGDIENEELTWHLISQFTRNNHHNREECFGDFYREVLLHLMDKGESNFELVKDEDDKLVVRKPHRWNNIKRCGPILIKKDVRRELSEDMKKAEYSFAKKSNVWTLKLPSEVINPRQYRQMQRRLTGRSLGLSDALLQPLMNGQVRLEDYTLVGDARLLKSTEPWGWDGRLSHAERINEYHGLYLRLKFRRSLAIVREHVVLELNTLLKRIGYNTRFGICGPPSSEKIEQAMLALQNGDNGFKEAHAIILRES